MFYGTYAVLYFAVERSFFNI